MLLEGLSFDKMRRKKRFEIVWIIYIYFSESLVNSVF
jgi:hypothetical protein